MADISRDRGSRPGRPDRKKKEKGAILSVKSMDITQLKPYEDNPRNNDKGVEQVARMIQEFGFYNPIVVDQKNRIVAGHTRYKAALKLKLASVPVVVLDLPDGKFESLNIADNRSGELSKCDFGKLAKNLNKIAKTAIDGSLTGFNPKEISKILAKAKSSSDEFAEGRVPFTEELRESHNFVLLYFNNDIDWLQALSLFGLKTVKALHSKPGYVAGGTGRVLYGPDAINSINKAVKFESQKGKK